MVKKSVLLMSVVAAGLMLGSVTEAVKPNVKAEVERGPMDRWVIRTPRSSTLSSDSSSSQESTPVLRRPLTNPVRSTSELTSEQILYLLAREGVDAGLTPLQRAWLNK